MGRTIKLSNETYLVNDLYRTTEIRVGTWTDGKPIYRVVLVYNNPSLNNYVYHGINSINEITSIRLMLIEGGLSGNYRILPTVYNTGSDLPSRFEISLYTFNNANFYISAGSYYTENVNNLALKIILEYTKTTD